MDGLLELQKQMEIDFLKEHSYEQINDMFRKLKTKLDEAESKVKNQCLFSVSQQRELLINFMTVYDGDENSQLHEDIIKIIDTYLKIN